MNEIQKAKRYQRLYVQIESLMAKSNDPTARMATLAALLHNKLEYFFWTGFYLLKNGVLTVGPYQGAVACLELAKDKGVCWAAINSQKTVIVPDVEKFPGHIACDSRSKSEIVVPVRHQGAIIGVLDVDSKELNSFDETDAGELEKIVELIFI